MRCFYGWQGGHGMMRGGFMGSPFTMLIWALIIGGALWLILSNLNSTKRPAVVSNHIGGEQALDILQKRYASGEIDEDTYLDMKDKLIK